MTSAIVAALFFHGNQARACQMLGDQKYILRMVGPSRFNRRLHRIKPLLLTLFAFLGEYWKDLNPESVYSIDSFPVAGCDNIRIPRARIYQGQDYRGYIPSKKRYFYGVRVHLLVTRAGEPVELFLLPGAYADVAALERYAFDLSPGSIVYGDRAYND